jgi:hypothetical protein
VSKNPLLKFIFVLFGAISALSCGASSAKNDAAVQERLRQKPSVILWAWERPENLEFADPAKYGVAFLAQTLELKTDEVIFRPRRQPLKVADNAYLIAVTRIESSKVTGKEASLSDAQIEKIVELVLKSLEMRNVRAVQIDFDAAVSERNFYRKLLNNLRARLPESVPLSITALASFCIGDRWFKDLPVDEAVPMIFRMGADSQTIKSFLANGQDFNEPLCRSSYGIATDEPLSINFDLARRTYIFNSRAWKSEDLAKIP